MPPEVLTPVALPVARRGLMGGGQLPGEAWAWKCSQRAPGADGEVASSRVEARTWAGILVASSEISGPSLPLELESDRCRGLRSKYRVMGWGLAFRLWQGLPAQGPYSPVIPLPLPQATLPRPLVTQCLPPMALGQSSLGAETTQPEGPLRGSDSFHPKPLSPAS